MNKRENRSHVHKNLRNNQLLVKYRFPKLRDPQAGGGMVLNQFLCRWDILRLQGQRSQEGQRRAAGMNEDHVQHTEDSQMKAETIQKMHMKSQWRDGGMFALHMLQMVHNGG